MILQVTSAEGSDTSRLLKEGKGEGNPPLEDERTQKYDAVVLATPLTKDKTDIQFETSKNHTFGGRYERVVATLVHGTLRKEAFKMSGAVDDILVTNPDLVYNSIGRQLPLDIENCDKKGPSVYKLFSPSPLTQEQLSLFFSEVKEKESVDWLAYPHYPEKESGPALFELESGLYHLNAVEWASSAMEMSAVGARNVALLALKYLLNDPKFGNLYTQRDEL